MKYYSTMKWQAVHNETVIKIFQTVTAFRSYNLQMDNPHFSDIGDDSEINYLNLRGRKGSLTYFLTVMKIQRYNALKIEGGCTAIRFRFKP